MGSNGIGNSPPPASPATSTGGATATSVDWSKSMVGEHGQALDETRTLRHAGDLEVIIGKVAPSLSRVLDADAYKLLFEHLKEKGSGKVTVGDIAEFLNNLDFGDGAGGYFSDDELDLLFGGEGDRDLTEEDLEAFDALVSSD